MRLVLISLVFALSIASTGAGSENFKEKIGDWSWYAYSDAFTDKISHRLFAYSNHIDPSDVIFVVGCADGAFRVNTQVQHFISAYAIDDWENTPNEKLQPLIDKVDDLHTRLNAMPAGPVGGYSALREELEETGAQLKKIIEKSEQNIARMAARREATNFDYRFDKGEVIKKRPWMRGENRLAVFDTSDERQLLTGLNGAEKLAMRFRGEDGDEVTYVFNVAGFSEARKRVPCE